MLTLAIDSTANTSTCALARDGGMLALSTINGLLTHSETLLPMVESMLANANLIIADVDLFAVSEGPGSFTGVRIGVATIKGLAFGSGKPCVGVSTLETLARNLDRSERRNVNAEFTVPVMDARRSQVYTAVFQGRKRLMPDMLIPLDELRDRLSDYEGEIRFCGDGYSLAKKFFAGDPRVCETPALLIPQNAFSVALTAESYFLSTEDKSSFTDRKLSPRYLRASQAERERLEKLHKDE